MGVWIETLLTLQICSPLQSHPVWVCGLKHQLVNARAAHDGHTLYGCVD